MEELNRKKIKQLMDMEIHEQRECRGNAQVLRVPYGLVYIVGTPGDFRTTAYVPLPLADSTVSREVLSDLYAKEPEEVDTDSSVPAVMAKHPLARRPGILTRIKETMSQVMEPDVDLRPMDQRVTVEEEEEQDTMSLKFGPYYPGQIMEMGDMKEGLSPYSPSARENVLRNFEKVIWKLHTLSSSNETIRTSDAAIRVANCFKGVKDSTIKSYVSTVLMAAHRAEHPWVRMERKGWYTINPND